MIYGVIFFYFFIFAQNFRQTEANKLIFLWLHHFIQKLLRLTEITRNYSKLLQKYGSIFPKCTFATRSSRNSKILQFSQVNFLTIFFFTTWIGKSRKILVSLIIFFETGLLVKTSNHFLISSNPLFTAHWLLFLVFSYTFSVFFICSIISDWFPEFPPSCYQY